MALPEIKYFKVNDVELSHYVSGLNVNKTYRYNAQTNAAGDTVVDVINFKRTVTVTFIPMETWALGALLRMCLDNLSFTITYLEPATEELETINCIAESRDIEYLRLSNGHCIMTNAFTLTFTEL